MKLVTSTVNFHLFSRFMQLSLAGLLYTVADLNIPSSILRFSSCLFVCLFSAVFGVAIFYSIKKIQGGLAVEKNQTTVNSLVSDHPWCTRKWSLTRSGRLREKSTKLLAQTVSINLNNNCYIKLLPHWLKSGKKKTKLLSLKLTHSGFCNTVTALHFSLAV